MCTLKAWDKCDYQPMVRAMLFLKISFILEIAIDNFHWHLVADVQYPPGRKYFNPVTFEHILTTLLILIASSHVSILIS